MAKEFPIISKFTVFLGCFARCRVTGVAAPCQLKMLFLLRKNVLSCTTSKCQSCPAFFSSPFHCPLRFIFLIPKNSYFRNLEIIFCFRKKEADNFCPGLPFNWLTLFFCFTNSCLQNICVIEYTRSNLIRKALMKRKATSLIMLKFYAFAANDRKSFSENIFFL